MTNIPVPLVLELEDWKFEVLPFDTYVQVAIIEPDMITHYMRLNYEQICDLSDYLQLMPSKEELNKVV